MESEVNKPIKPNQLYCLRNALDSPK